MWTAALHPLPILPWCLVLALALWSSFAEAAGRGLGGRLLLGSAALGCCVGWALGGGEGAGQAALGGAALCLPYLFLAATARCSLRDAALMGSVGTWLGLRDGVLALLGVSLAGLVCALVVAVRGQGAAVALARASAGPQPAEDVGPAGQVRLGGGSVLAARPADPGRARTGRLGVGGARRLLSQRMPYGPAIVAGLLVSGLWRFVG